MSNYNENKTAEELNQELINAVECNDLKEVKMLIKAGADIHTNDEQPLTSAVFYGHLPMTTFLIKKGANIQVGNGKLLQYTAENIEMLKLLIDNGLNIKESQVNILKISAEKEADEVVEFLIVNGAPISKPHIYGNDYIRREMKEKIQTWSKAKRLNDKLTKILNEEKAPPTKRAKL